MKILQLNKYFYQKGGAETVFFNTISTLENRGHQVIPFALKNKKNKFSEYESYFVDYPELSESNIWTKIFVSLFWIIISIPSARAFLNRLLLLQVVEIKPWQKVLIL